MRARVLLPLLGAFLFVFSAIAPLALIPSRSIAQGLPESEWGEPWNSVGVGVRAIGMAGAFTAVSDDLSGAYWNPGGLVRMKDTQFAIMSGSPYIVRSNEILPRLFNRYTSANIRKSFWWRMAYTNFGSIGFVTTKWKPWAAGWMMMRSFHPESLVPWQETYQQGTFTLPLNTARTAGLGINVKMISSDILYEYARPVGVYPADSSFSFEKVNGWAMDVGGVYVVPLPTRDRYRQMNFGMMARNLIGRKTIGNTETEIPREAQLGMAFMFDDLLPRERSLISVDLHQGLLASLGANSQQIRLGYEQWFLQNIGAARVGYAAPFPKYDNTQVAGGYLYRGVPSYTCGLTFMLADLQLDMAATSSDLFGFGRDPRRYSQEEMNKLGLTEDNESTLSEAPENPVLARPTGYLPIEKTRVYFQLTYHWKSPAAPPYARVKVEPLVFSPKKGEVAVFNIDYRDELGIESWALEVRNSAKLPVRTFAGKGPPPSRLVWDGLDDRFTLAQDDDHIYSLRVRNREGVETVTSPQAFRVFTPEENVKGDPTLIYRLLDEQAKKDAEGRNRMNDSINRKLQEQKAPMTGAGSSGTGQGPGAPAPVLPAQPSATISDAIPFRGLSQDQILRVQVPPTGDQGGQMVLEYSTQRYILKYLVKEIKGLTEQSFSTVGSSAKSFMVQARYGNHLMVVETPLEAAQALKTGRIDDKQWARLARFTLDGIAIQPAID